MTETSLTVILDIDGTLVDSSYHHALAWHRAFRECGLTVPMWRIHRSIGMGGDRLVTEVTGEVVEEKMGDVLRTRWQEAYTEMHPEIEVLPGARELIEKLQEQGHQVCVASSGSKQDTDFAIDLLGVRQQVGTVITGDDADSSKPAPDLLGVALRRSGGDAAVVVGDSVYDVEAASKLDLPCVTVRTGGFGQAELEAAGAVRVFDDLTAALDLDWAALVSASHRLGLA